MKRKKNKLLIILFTILTLLISYAILFYFNFFQDYVEVNENNIISSNKVDGDFNSSYTSNIKFDDIIPHKISDSVTIKILDKTLSSINIYEKSLRYYIPLDVVCSILDYNVTKDLILNDSTTIDFKDNKTCLINNTPYVLRGNIIIEDNRKYISISDIEHLFNLTAVFDFDAKEIKLLNKLPEIKVDTSTTTTSGRACLLRLEDFSAGYGTLNSENQVKYKFIGNFLKDNGIKFHIAWVPRFKCPSQDIDNNLLENNNLANIGFINTLDYLINSGAEVGLHGYSHQADDDTSLNGIELSYKKNTSEKETRQVIENAIDTADFLNIPCDFFESPHYKATNKQKKIIEEYFQFIYEPKNIFIYTKLHKDNNNLFIPTPLGYVKNCDTSNIEKYLKNPTPGQLASLFYHPAIELDYININLHDNNININYDTNSPLYRIVKALKDNNYVSIHVTDFKN